jgi:hypothetical protein
VAVLGVVAITLWGTYAARAQRRRASVPAVAAH